MAVEAVVSGQVNSITKSTHTNAQFFSLCGVVNVEKNILTVKYELP